MQLLRAGEVPNTYNTQSFCVSRSRAVLLAVVIFVLAALLAVFGYRQTDGMGRYIAYAVGAMLLLGLYFFRGYITARFRPENWLARIAPTGVYIKFRSYLNDDLPDSDRTVVLIPFDEVRSVGPRDERMATTDMEGGRATQTIRYVEFDLATDVGSLADAVSAERSRTAPSEKRWYGSSSTLYNDYPVRVVPPSFVRVQWGVVPGRNAFLNALRPYVHVASPTSSGEDFTQLASLPREQQEQRLRDLDAAGSTLVAIATARRLYGYDLAQAKAFVEGLRTK